MLPSYGLLRERLAAVIADKRQQGHDVAGLVDELQNLPDSYDALAALARRLADLPVRADWPYVEPSDLEGIWAECDPLRPLGPISTVDLEDAARRVEAAFLASVCGSILGAYFGPGRLARRWLKPFNDDMHTALAWFHERSLAALAKRMGELPGRVAAELGKAG